MFLKRKIVQFEALLNLLQKKHNDYQINWQKKVLVSSKRSCTYKNYFSQTKDYKIKFYLATGKI